MDTEDSAKPSQNKIKARGNSIFGFYIPVFVASVLLLGTAGFGKGSESYRPRTSNGRLARWFQHIQIFNWTEQNLAEFIKDKSRPQFRLRPTAWLISVLLFGFASFMFWHFRSGIFEEVGEFTAIGRVAVLVLIAHALAAPFMTLSSALMSFVYTPLMPRGSVTYDGEFPRLNPALTGLGERVLLTPVAYLLWGLNSQTTLIAVFSAYVVLRTFRIEFGDNRSTDRTSLQAIWNIALNISFPVLAVWLNSSFS